VVMVNYLKSKHFQGNGGRSSSRENGANMPPGGYSRGGEYR
jgi:hypothetical protein